MHLKTLFILFIIYSVIACRQSKSDRQYPFESKIEGGDLITSTDSMNRLLNRFAAAKDYDSVLWLGKKVVNERLNRDLPDSAMAAAKICYDTLIPALAVQKELMLFLFSKKERFEKNQSAIRRFYNLFTSDYYYFFFNYNYDAAYVTIAEYFISLQKKLPELPPDKLQGFYQTLGIAYNVAGDLKKAMYYYGLIYDIDLKDPEQENLPASTINRSIGFFEAKLFDSVISIVNYALRKNEISSYYKSGLYIILGEALLNKGKTDEAEKAIEKSEQSALKIGDQENQAKRLFDIYRTKNMLRVSQENFSQALYCAQTALSYGLISENEYRDRSIGKLLLQIGSVFKKLNHPDSAAWYTHQALYTVANVDSADIYSLPAEKDVYAENTMMDALDSLALLWDERYIRTKDTGVLKKALQARTLAFIAEKKLLEAFSYDESMKNMLLAGKKRSERALYNCYTLWQTDHSPQWIERAILMNENSKATTLLHSIKKNVVLSQMQEQDSTALELNRNRLYTIMLERELNTNNDNTRKTAIQSTLDSLQKNLLLLENDLKTRLPALSRTGRDDPGTMIRSLKKRLQNDNACLLQYFNTDSGALVLWLDYREQCGMNLVSAAAMNVVDSFLTQGIRSPVLFENNRPEYLRLSASCTDIVLPGAVQQAVKERRYKKLLVIPDGSFSVLPFEALTPVNGEYLVKYCSVYNGYSIGTLFANDSIKINTNNIAVFTPYSKKEFTGKNRLAFTQDEANAINHAFGQLNTFDDTAATIKAFRNALNKNRVIHIATHAEAVNGAEPKVFFYDSSLNMSELYASPTKAELVVLSSCETGIGTLDPNEGPLSLARGFYYAGAKNVVSGLWRIEDSKTAEMFKYFYRHYDRGHTGRLLYHAKLKFLENNPGKYQAPYYWAGLVHTGLDDDDAPKKTVSVFRILFILIPLTALLLFWNRFRRKRSAV